MFATYWLSGGGRSEDRPHWFTGCATCSRIPSRVVVDAVTGAETVLWQVIDVKARIRTWRVPTACRCPIGQGGIVGGWLRFQNHGVVRNDILAIIE
jgi:uncharacterized protein YfaQ (DUF2300 family)